MDQLAHRRGQYRSAVASGERVGYVQQLILEADPTLPRSGTDRSRNFNKTKRARTFQRAAGRSAMRNQSGQYRNAVASGESQNADNYLILETHPTLPRFGTDPPRIADLPTAL